jgi:DNA-binding response OmpR family regulator
MRKDMQSMHPNSGSPPNNPARGRILLAENDDAMRAFLSRTLSGMGYKVQEISTAGGLEDFLTRMEEEDAPTTSASVDIIVTGITMPGKTILDMLRELRRRVRQTPIVLITSLEDDTTLALALRLGAAAVFDKPFNIDALRSFLEDTSRRRTGIPADANMSSID